MSSATQGAQQTEELSSRRGARMRATSGSGQTLTGFVVQSFVFIYCNVLFISGSLYFEFVIYVLKLLLLIMCCNICFLVLALSCLYIAIGTVKLCVLNVSFAVFYVCLHLVAFHSVSYFVIQFELNRSTSPPGGNQVDGLPPTLSLAENSRICSYL